LSVLEVHKKYQNLKSEVKDIIVEGNQIETQILILALYPHNLPRVSQENRSYFFYTVLLECSHEG
jgi:hypothetical protein